MEEQKDNSGDGSGDVSVMSKTTTISTIAVQSGKTRLVIALLHCGEWVQLKILEVNPELTALGDTLAEAVELQKAHDEVLRQLQSKQSPVEELLRQADQLIATQKPRAEVYAAMAESLGRAWNDVNAHLEVRKVILDLNVQYHVKAGEFFERMDNLDSACSDTVVPVEIESVKNFLTDLHELRRSVLEALMGALQTGNTLIAKLKELGAEGTLDSRPDRLRSSVNRAVAQVQGWMDLLHMRRQLLESTFTRRKGQLEKCLALAMLATDLRELEETVVRRRELLNSSAQLGDSSSSAELLQYEHKKLLPEAKQLQEKAIKITKATEQLVQSGCFAGDQATGQAYAVLSSASDYLDDLQHRDVLYERVIAFFRSAQAALNKLDQLEVQLKTSELPSTSPQLAILHEQCAKTIEEIASPPIGEGYAILEFAGRTLDTSGVRHVVEELENRRIELDGLCVAHKEENKRINQALNNFVERQSELHSWMMGIADAFLEEHRDMGEDLVAAKEFLDLHNHLLTDLQTKGNEINSLLLTLPPILEYLDERQRREVDAKVEALHDRWIKLKNILETRLDLSLLYVKFHTEAGIVGKEMDDMEDAIRKGGEDISEDDVRALEERMEAIVPLYQSAKNTGLTFVNEARKVTEPHLDTNRACACVQSVLDALSGRQLTVNRKWQSFREEVVERREIQVLLETNIMESTKTINWVTKLDTQLYPVITTTATNPIDIASHVESKLQTVLPEVRRAQLEVEQRLQTADSILAKTPDKNTSEIRGKLSEMNKKLLNITAEYQTLLQKMIGYFNNLSELDKSVDNYNREYGKMSLPLNPTEMEYMMREHDGAKQGILNLFRFAQNDCQDLVNRINKQEPKDCAQQDIEKLHYTLEMRRDAFEKDFKTRRENFEAHRQLCQFDNDLQQINDTLDDLSRQLAGVRGQYGESLTSAKANSLAFVYFEKTIELLEQRINTFVATGEQMLKDQHVHSPHISKQIRELKDRWDALKKQIEETRRLIDLSIKYFDLVEEADEWFKEGSRLLVTIARKSTSVKRPQEAQELLNEIEVFLKPGEAKQSQRIKQISELAEQLYGHESPNRIHGVVVENREMMESFSVITNDLNTLARNLKTAEEQRERMLKEQEAAKLKAEADRAKTEEAARLRAEVERARMEEEARKIRAKEEEAARLRAELERARVEEESRKITIEVVKTEETRIIPVQVTNEVRKTPVYIEEVEMESLEGHKSPLIEIEIPIQIEPRGSPKMQIEEVEELPKLEAPIFTSPLNDQVIEEGSRFTFVCQVTGDPVPVVTWHKDGISIQNNPDYQTTFDQGLCSLTIEETFAEDSARYTCKAINAAGSAETAAFLSVKEMEVEEQRVPPMFVRLLQAGVAKVGEPYQLECKVEGNPLPTVQWFKNSECVDNSSEYVITYNNGEAILRFEQVYLEDRAEYSCKASNEVGTAQTSASLNVTPLEPMEPPTFTTPLSNVMARAGQKIKLECEVCGLPPPNLSWSQNGKPVKETRELKLHRDGQKATLIIHEAFPKDAGTYSVTAANPVGEASCTCSVSVKGRLPAETSDSELASDMEPVKPSIQVPLKDVAINEGNRVRLDCIIVGQPEPEVIWYHDDRPVKESPDFQLLFQGDRCSLIIQEALLEDAGEYKVVALNSAGEASSRAHLTVSAVKPQETDAKPEEDAYETFGSAPKFEKLLSDVLVSEGDKVILEASVSGDPRPEVKWLLNNNTLVSDHITTTHDEKGNVRLQIENVRPEDRGVYTVKASNTCGDAKCFAQLIVKSLRTAETKVHEEVKVAPTFKESFSDRSVFGGTAAKFECIVTGKPTPKVRWLFNDIPVTGKNFLTSTSGDRQVLTIPEAVDSGTVTCIAENEAGKASCTATLTVELISDITLPTMSRDLQQHTESSYTFKREVNVQSSTSTSSKVITSSTAAPEAHVEEHRYVAQDAKSFKQVNLDAPEISESHRQEEYHKVGNEPPVIHEKSSSIFTIGGKEAEPPKLPPPSAVVVQKSIFKARPPKFMTPVIGKIVDQDVDVVLEGILDGQPTPQVSWTKNGSELKSSEGAKVSFQHNCARIELKKVGIADAGRYTCTAVNEAGKAISTADLVVRKTIFPPVFGRRLQAQVIKKGDRVIMEVEVTGTPDPAVTWFKDNVPIKDAIKDSRLKTQGNCHTLILEKADLVHTGKYMIRAVNSGGEAQSIADIAVFEPTPDTMVEVVKTVVFEDVRKHETLASSADKSLEIKSGPVEVAKLPISIPPSYTSDIQESFRTEISTHREDTIRHDTKTLTLERTNPVPDLEMPKKYEPPQTLPPDTLDEGIQTSSITKQQSLDFFVKKMKEVDEPKVKEVIKPAPIKQELYTKFEEVVQEKVEPPKVDVPKFEVTKITQAYEIGVKREETVEPPKTVKFEVPKIEPVKFEVPPKPVEPLKKVEPVKFEVSKIADLPKLEPFPVKSFSSYSSFLSTAQSQLYEEFKLTPEPPAEICYTPKPEVPIKEDVTTKVKRLEESHKELSAAEIPTGAVKIFPTKVTEQKFSSSKCEYSKVETTPSMYYKAETIGPVERAITPVPPVVEKSSYSSQTYEKQSYVKTTNGYEPSAEGLAMEKTWAHKASESNLQKSWPPPQTEPVKITPSWSAQSTLEKKWTPAVEVQSSSKKETKIITPVVTEHVYTESKTCVQEELPPPLPVPHYVAQVSHTSNIKQVSQVISEKTEVKSEMSKASEIIKSWPPIESLPIRPASVQDITDELYLEPGTPPEIGYAEPPAPQRKVSLVESIEQNLDKVPSKVLPGAVRTVPLPPKKEPAPPAPPKQSVDVPFTRFPELEPFPFKPEPQRVRPAKQPPPPTPSKFIKGRFTDSDYESDFESVRIPAKWKPYASDTEELGFRHVNPPKAVAPRSRSIEKDVLAPSQFEQPPQTDGPPRPAINFEACKQIRKEALQVKKFTKTHQEVKKSSPPLKPGSPPEFVVPPEPKVKPQSPKTKHKVVVDGYMADTEETLVKRHEEKHVYQSSQSYTEQKIVQQSPKPAAPKLVHHKKHVTSAASAKKKLVSTPIVTTEKVLEPFPFKPDPPAPTKAKLPPPPSPSKFVKGGFKESDYESDYDGRIPPVWRSEHDHYYKPVRPILTPTGRHSQTRERTPTPPTEFDNPDRVSMPTRPKFEPIDKAKKSVKLEQIIKPVVKPTPIFRPTPVTEVIIATPALKPGSPPEIAYTPGPKYYRSTTSAPYHNAVATETSNVMHFDESTEHSHRTVSLQQTTKVIQFGEQNKRSTVPPPPKPKKFVPGEFRESDYESEVERTVIKPKWGPTPSQGDPQYRKVKAPGIVRASSVPTQQQRVPTPMEYDTQPPYQPQTQLVKSTATKMASKHMDSMTHTFKSKAQQFVTDIMDDVSKKQQQQQQQKPILKAKEDGDAQVYREESRAAQYGTKHVDPDTGLIYFKYDFGYEFGVVLPGEGKNGEIPMPRKTIIQPPQRSESIEMPVYHEKTAPTKKIAPSNKNVKWEPTSESEMSEYEGDGKTRKNRWEQSSCSPVSLSPSLPSTSPAFNNYSGSAAGLRGTETPPSCPGTPAMQLTKRAPVFITPLRDIAAVSGQTARFECIVQSEPAPNVLWSKNGRIIENSNDHQIFYRNGVCRLTIPRAFPEDAGTYSCTATNQIGTVGTTATLQVPGERRSAYI